MFMRILGNTMGAAILGGIMNLNIKQFVTANPELKLHGENPDVAHLLLDPETLLRLPAETIGLLKEGLASSLHAVYIGVFVFAVLSLFYTFLLPASIKKEESNS